MTNPVLSHQNSFTKKELYEIYDRENKQNHLVRINFISSADGAVTLNGRSGQLGSKTDQNLMKVLRAMSDVVLVGAGTVRAEGYGGLGLKDEDMMWREAHGLNPRPRIAIVTNSADLDPEMSVFAKASEPPIVITNNKADADHLFAVSDVVRAGDKNVDSAAAIAALNNLGLKHVLCEGGPHLFGSLLDAEMVDEVCLTLAPKFVGGSAGRISVSDIEKGRNFGLLSILSDADSLLYLRYSRTV